MSNPIWPDTATAHYGPNAKGGAISSAAASPSLPT